jgi:hypothetical protein
VSKLKGPHTGGEIPMDDSIAARFWKRVSKSESGCWQWTAARNNNGYGFFRIGGRAGKAHLAHRVSFTIHKGQIPPGLCVCHSCDNPACVNPAHLWLGTHAANHADRSSKGRSIGMMPHAKLNRRSVLEIRASKESQRKLAARYGVSNQLVGMVRNRQRWSHV